MVPFIPCSAPSAWQCHGHPSTQNGGFLMPHLRLTQRATGSGAMCCHRPSHAGGVWVFLGNPAHVWCCCIFGEGPTFGRVNTEVREIRVRQPAAAIGGA